MRRLQIALASSVYRPGEQLCGECLWELEKPVEKLELWLSWHTKGKGTQDGTIVATQQLASPGVCGSRRFTFGLPDGPWSFSGKLITLIWTVEIVAMPGYAGEAVDFVLSPTGMELQIEEVS